jgi:hypothetical protein
VGAVPNTERNPHFIDERIEGVDRSGSGEFTRHGSGFLFLDVVLSYLFFPDTSTLPETRMVSTWLCPRRQRNRKQGSRKPLTIPMSKL